MKKKIVKKPTVKSTRRLKTKPVVVLEEPPPVKKTRRKKSPSRIYWIPELDKVIDEYNKSTDADHREQLFREHLDYPLDKMAENIINRFKFPYINNSFEDLKRQVVSFLVMNLSKYTPDKGKSFSYFSVIAKNYLILHNNNSYKQEKRSVYLSDTTSETYIPLEDMVDLQSPETEEQDELKEFVKVMLDYWDRNLNKHFKKKRDIDIANAVLQLFRRVDFIENFNKKALYVMIREMTDSKTTYITKVINKMKDMIEKQLIEYKLHGKISDGGSRFFTY